MPLHLDPNLQQLSPEEVAKLELRACCICGVIKNANDMEECLTCDGFMCAEHKCDEHTCDCSTENVPTQTLTNILSKS
jgi:hypothetical protein